eukprot:8458417-Alexandrium_andersonii.AAC.1
MTLCQMLQRRPSSTRQRDALQQAPKAKSGETAASRPARHGRDCAQTAADRKHRRSIAAGRNGLRRSAPWP